MSSTSPGLDSASANNLFDGPSPPYPREEVHQSDEEMLLGRRIFEVSLQKEGSLGIGVTIVGGETTNSLDLGIFVKSLAPGGPAEKDGRIKPGDRLIAIGGTSLEGKQHHEAVAMIRDGGPIISLLVSQIRPPGTIKKRSTQEAQVEFERKLRESMLDYSGRQHLYEVTSSDQALTVDFDLEFDKNKEIISHYNQQAPLSNTKEEKHKNDIDSVNSFLRFDDIVHANNPPTFSDSNRSECNSDEENYPLEPPPRPKKENPSEKSKKKQPKSNQQLTTNWEPGSKQRHFENPIYMNERLDTLGSPTRKTQMDANGEDVVFQRLKEDEVLSLALDDSDRQEWQGFQKHNKRRKANFTGEHEEDLQLLGDIAALDADDSSSDSDFDSAVKKTIEGVGNRVMPGNKAINAVRPMVISEVTPSASEVIYEVILERQGRSLGIITNMQVSPGYSHKGTYIKELMNGEPAHQGGVLAPGDRLIEVSGQNVENCDNETVQMLLDSAPAVTTVKVSRSSVRDAELNTRESHRIQQERLANGSPDPAAVRQVPPLNAASFSYGTQHEQVHETPFSRMIASAPRDRTLPLDDQGVYIVPPPPPLNLSADLLDDTENTQSDVDSDVLDSSRSELETIYRQTDNLVREKPGPILREVFKDKGGEGSTHLDKEKRARVKHRQKTPENILGDPQDKEDVKKTSGAVVKGERQLDSDSFDETLQFEDSVEFDEQLLELKEVLDQQMEGQKKVSPSSLSRSSLSSTDSVVRSPHKTTDGRQLSAHEKGDDNSEEEHDDDDDVVIKMYGDEPVDSRADANDIRSKAKPGSKTDLNSNEPQIIDVTLKRKEGFGFTVAGSVNTGGCYIKQLVSDPAVADGRMRPGDKILKVNDHDATMMSHVEAVTLLRNIPDTAYIQLLRYPTDMVAHQKLSLAKALASDQSKNGETRGDIQTPGSSVKALVKSGDTPKAVIRPYDHKSDSDTGEVQSIQQTPESGVLRIELSKPSAETSFLGISLVCREVEGQSGIFVKRLKVGGVAYNDGRLKPGDRILQANGKSYIGLTRKQAVTSLREAGNIIILTVTRPDASTARTLTRGQAEDSDGYEDLPDKGVNEPEDDVSGLAEEAESLVNDETGRKAFTKKEELKYVSARKLRVDVPVVMSQEWLDDLPLISLAGDLGKDYTHGLLGSLADLVQGGEPNEEFKNLRQMKESGPCNVAKWSENRPKNRYRNILPYDVNRVKLNARHNDYINASRVTLEVGQREHHYLVCQGPVEQSVSDLWWMIWQESVKVIAMLTDFIEAGKTKCQRYWPATKEDSIRVEESSLVVKLTRCTELKDLKVFVMSVQEERTGETREITVLQYFTWPDHSVPETALSLLKLLQVVHLIGKGSPPVIHCSAGVGRTGVFVTIDAALATIEMGEKLDLYEIVHNLRNQRYGMVQTTDQYLFCYTACMEALLSLEPEK